MNTRSRLLLLAVIMAAVSLLATGSALYILYQNEVADVRNRLSKTAQTQARLAELLIGGREPEEALPMIEEAHERVESALNTSELLLVRRQGDKIEFLVAHQSGKHLRIAPVRFGAMRAEASTRGLAGESGTIIGLDYDGNRVIAAYEPVRHTSWAIVSKVDLGEIQAPFLRAALFGALLDLGLVLLAAVLFIRFTDPLVERLEETEQHHRTLFNQSFEMLWTLQRDGTVLEVNRTALDTAGVIESAVCGHPFWQTRWWAGLPAEQQKLEWAVAEAAAGNLARMELAARGFGNRTLTVDLSLKPITNRKGEVTLLNAEARDITERKRAEEALQQAEEKYRSIFENAAEGIFQTTPDGRFRAANPSLARILGYDSTDELIRERSDIERTGYVNPKQRAEFKKLMAEKGFTRGFEYEAYCKDGSRVWLSENSRAVRDANGTVMYYEGIVQDISERRRHEEERERLLLELQEALANVKTLSGLLPICASCKKIRDDGGYWSQIESYISERSQAQFSHGICPDCARQLYPEHFHKMFPEFEEEEQKDS